VQSVASLAQGDLEHQIRSDEVHYAARICLAGPAHGLGRGNVPGNRVHGHQLPIYRWEIASVSMIIARGRQWT